MTKSFRNLTLSLLLAAGAAGLAACDGTTGPAGVTGDAGPAGPAGAPGDAGKAGDSADDVTRTYAYLKTWGKAEGKAACSDPVLKSPDDAFPGPVTLKKLTGNTGGANTAVYLLTAAAHLGNANASNLTNEEGKCSNAVYAAFSGNNAAFEFTLTHGDASNDITETPRKGTTPTLRNRTLTEVKKEFREGDVRVRFAQGASEPGERDLVFTRCDIPNGLSGSTLTGRYRVVKITEDEYLLKTNTDTTTEKDTGTGSKVNKTTIKVCVRFSAPGTVKCYILETAQKRKTSDDKLDTTAGSATATEQIALYKNGQMTMVDPMPDKMNLVPGGTTPGSNNNLFGSNFVAVSNPAKLCNFFNGVIGTAAAAPSGGGIDLAAARAACIWNGLSSRAATQRAPGTWNGSCTCNQRDTTLDGATGQCLCAAGLSWRGNNRGCDVRR